MRRGSRTAAKLLWAVLLAFATVGGAHAQGVTTAAVGGTVTGTAGAPLPNAQVTVRNSATGSSRTVVTDNSGRYFVSNLLPGGPYTISATRIGSSPVTRSGVQLVLNQTTRVDLTLADQAVALEGLTVTAENNPAISNSRTGASTVIRAETIENLPNLSRNFAELAVVSPYVTVTGGSTSVGGANNRFNNIQIDGAVNNDVFGLASSGIPGGQANGKAISLEAIDQFQVLVAPFDVRQTGFTGGLINAVTKSGTNQFHGSVFGYFRNQDFIRDRLVTSADTFGAIEEFSNRQFGFSLGGPVVRDRIHFFANAEIEQRTTPTTFGIESPEGSLRVQHARIRQVQEIARGYGLEPGNAEIYTRKNPLTNLFGRMDFRLNDANRLVLRHNFTKNSDDTNPSRGGSRFDLSSNAYQFRNTTHSSVLQLFSQLGADASNELLLNVQFIRDRRTPNSRFAQIEVTTRDSIGGQSVSGAVRFGAEAFSQANELDQDIVEFTDNYSRTLGNHRVTLGATAQYLHFRNLFFPNSLGVWRFGSPADFQSGLANSYTLAVPYSADTDPSARFEVFQAGGYVQDEFTVGDNLTFTAGARVDVPYVLDTPRENAAFRSRFSENGSPLTTGDVPSGNLLFSPRVGFNWQSSGDNVTQVRGGVGIFTGRIPYVWLSNAFGNTGRESLTLTCSGTANTPTFNPLNPPTTCRNGSGAQDSGGATVNLFDSDFKFPQDLKASLGIDQELPFGFTGTLEGVYTKARNQILVEELNLVGAQEVPASSMQGIGDRIIYGTPQASRDFAFNPVRVANNFRNVVRMRNTSEGYSYALSAELARSFRNDQLSLRTAYTYARSYDVQSLTSSQATSNIGFAPIGRALDERVLAPSAFDRPHKVLVQGTARLLPRFGGTDVSVLYVGQSGSTYSYTYDGDINGDGFQNAGIFGRNNDLFYVPNNVNELAMDADDARLLEELIELEPCLRDSRGKIMERNSCRSPWSNSVDLRVVQGIRGGPGNLKLELNIFNFSNLLNSDWGLQQAAPNNTVTILDLDGRVNNDRNAAMEFAYDLVGFARKDANGTLRARRPYNTFNLSSRYQVQLGLRYAF